MFSLFDFAIAYALFLLAAIAWCFGALGRGGDRRPGSGRVRPRGRAAIDSAPRRF